MENDTPPPQEPKPPIDMDLVRASSEERAIGFLGIGRFLFEFSQLEFTIRVALANLLALNDNSFEIVTSPYNFAALCNVTCKMSCLKSPQRKDEFEKIYNACQTLNNTRVIVAHGMWVDDMDGLFARHVSRKSLEAKFHSFKNGELERFAEEAQRLLKAVMGFQPGNQ
jgi:hypothetical protein